MSNNEEEKIKEKKLINNFFFSEKKGISICYTSMSFFNFMQCKWGIKRMHVLTELIEIVLVGTRYYTKTINIDYDVIYVTSQR